MNTFAVLVWDNLKNSFRTKKALIFLVLYLLVFGLITYGFFRIQEDIERQMMEQGISELQRHFLNSFARTFITQQADNSAIASFLFSVPAINIVLFFVSLIGTPLLLFILNYDKVSQEVYDGTIRYVLFRASRFQIFFAKFLSGLIECALITLVALVLGILWGSIKFKSVDFGTSISFGLRYWVIAQFFLIAFIALSLMTSSIFKKPFISLIVAFISYVAMPIIPLFLSYVSPYDRAYFEGLFFPLSAELIFSIGIYLAYAAVFLITGFLIFKRKDL